MRSPWQALIAGPVTLTVPGKVAGVEARSEPDGWRRTVP